MKSYPSMTNKIRYNIPVICQPKFDGNNIRAEWNKKQGFYKFCSRKKLIDETSDLGESINLIKEKYEEDLSKIFVKQKWKSVICFFEYHGPNSFAGNHIDEDLTVTLIDVNPYKQGILEPAKFIDIFKYVDTPKCLFEGYITIEFVDKIKASSLEGMTFEGCVCKGKEKNRIVMFKIKSNAWLEKLMTYCQGNVNLFNELS